MQEHATRNITVMLDQINGGRQGAFTELVDAVYADLRRISAKAMAQNFDRPLEGLTRPPTEIAHDAVMELRKQRAAWVNREQFFAIATTLIFRLVLQYRRDRAAKKRGGGNRGAPIGPQTASGGGIDPPDERGTGNAPEDAGPSGALGALERLHAAYPRQAEVLTLTVLCNRKQEVAAEMVGVSVPQLQRDLRFAKAWLKDALAERTS